MDRQELFYVYILRCADSSYYVGHTEDVQARVETHNLGQGAAWTAARRPVELLYQESHPNLPSAVRREVQLKKWSRAKKEALIADDRDRLKILSRRQST